MPKFERVYPTRYSELGYTLIKPGCWQFVTMDTEQQVGVHYASRAELLADLPRYAAFYGCDGAL